MSAAAQVAEFKPKNGSQRSERDYALTLLDAVSAPVMITDPSGRIVRLNQACERLTGYASDEIKDRCYWELQPAPADSSGGSPGLGRLAHHPLGPTGELCWAAKDGRCLLINWTNSAIHGQDGQVESVVSTGVEVTERAENRELCADPIIDEHGSRTGAAAAATDITERRNAAEELHRSRQMLELVLDNIPQRVFWKDLKSAFLGCNRAFAEDMHLHDRGEVAGKNDYDLVAPELAARYAAEDRQVIDSGSPILNKVYSLRRADGSLLWLQTSKIPLHDRSGRVIGILGAYDDITEQKLNEQAVTHYAAELERSNADLEHFAYVASHDLQEPLRMVTSYVQLLAEDYGGRLDAEADDYIRFAVDGAKRMQQLIQDLLAYARVNSGVRQFTWINCNRVMDEVITNLNLAIAEAGASVIYDSLPSVVGDHSQLYQVFFNLVGNALKYRSSDPPLIRIDAELQEPAAAGCRPDWLFSVRDNGIGIAEQYFDRIFVIFQRLHARSDFEGTGLGLAICRKIIERHQGRIWVESQAGHGATFYFTLPA